MLFRLTTLWLLLWLTGCDATSTGALRGSDDLRAPARVTFTAVPERRPVEVTDAELRAFLRRVGPRVSPERFRAVMRELGVNVEMAAAPSTGQVVLASFSPAGEPPPDPAIREYLRWCQSRDRCIALPGGGRAFGPEARQAIALDFALHAVLPGIGEALQGLMDVRTLEAMVVATAVVYLALLAAPEPVSKWLAAKLTYVLLGYVGVSTLWGLEDGWREFSRDVDGARSFEAVRAAGERFGKRVGAQVARVLVMLVAWGLGGGLDAALPNVSSLPGAGVASQGLALEGEGAALVAVGDVQTVALGAGSVHVAFTSGAAVATKRRADEAEDEEAERQGAQSPAPKPNRPRVVVPDVEDEEQDDGNWHHIATNKNGESTVRGGPWTPRFEKFFKRAGMSLNDPANLVWVPGHKGPHPKEYHETVLRRIDEAMARCVTVPVCAEKLQSELRRLAVALTTPGHRLNVLVTRGSSE